MDLLESRLAALTNAYEKAHLGALQLHARALKARADHALLHPAMAPSLPLTNAQAVHGGLLHLRDKLKLHGLDKEMGALDRRAEKRAGGGQKKAGQHPAAPATSGL